MKEIKIQTHGEQFYSVTDVIKSELPTLAESHSGVLTVFCPHTSCALTINENYDPSAREDMQEFLKHLAPRNLAFIKHTDEGPDDSPSHMKSILLQSSLQFIVHSGQLMVGQWQGIYLCEFRDAPHTRKLWLNFAPN